MGGKTSGVQIGGRNIFLSAHTFRQLLFPAPPAAMACTLTHRIAMSVALIMSYPPRAIERATDILLSIVGGTAGPVIESLDAASMPKQPKVTLREHKLNEMQSAEVDVAQVDEALQRLDFVVAERRQSSDGVRWEITAPSHRFDIAIEADLIEEVCRIYGYNNIPFRQPNVQLPLAAVSLQQHR